MARRFTLDLGVNAILRDGSYTDARGIATLVSQVSIMP